MLCLCSCGIEVQWIASDMLPVPEAGVHQRWGAGSLQAELAGKENPQQQHETLQTTGYLVVKLV